MGWKHLDDRPVPTIDLELDRRSAGQYETLNELIFLNAPVVLVDSLDDLGQDRVIADVPLRSLNKGRIYDFAVAYDSDASTPSNIARNVPGFQAYRTLKQRIPEFFRNDDGPGINPQNIVLYASAVSQGGSA